MMTIHLKRETEELIQREIQRGSCKSPEEYVERAVRLLHEEEELLAQEKDAIAAQIASGLAQLDRGESVPGDVARSRLQQRKATVLAERPRS